MLRLKLSIICIILSILPYTQVQSSDEIDVPWYTTPKIDGILAVSEYPTSALSLMGVTSSSEVHICQNASALFIAFAIFDSTFSGDDIVIVNVGSEPPSPERTIRIDDYQIRISRSGSYSASGLSECRLAIGSFSTKWIIEISIGFMALGLSAGRKYIAFSIFISNDGHDIARWPVNADKENPKTWGMLGSSYSWGTIDLRALSLTPYPRTTITGQNVTISLTFTNKGNSPCSFVPIGFYVDDKLLWILNDTQTIEPSGSHIIDIVWSAIGGNHTIMAKLDPLNKIYETREDNNELSFSIYIQNIAKLTIRAEEGANISVNDNITKVGPSKEVAFFVNIGEVKIYAQKVLIHNNIRYVFQSWMWENGSSQNNTITFNILREELIEATYITEYRVKMSFLDSKGHLISAPTTIRMVAPNGSSITLTNGYDIWLQRGTLMISSIIWSSVDVKPFTTTYTILGPKELTINCRIYDVTVIIRDSISLPVSGANVSLLLPNRTWTSLTTNNDGDVIFHQIPTGRLTGTINNLGIIITIANQELTSDLTLSYTLMLSFNIILITVIVIIIVIVGTVFWIFKVKHGLPLPPPPPPLPPPPPPLNTA